jgi:hypothetical protein
MNDLALGRFDQFRVRKVPITAYDTTLTVATKLEAASLKADETIELQVHHSSLEVIRAVLSDPNACRICSLDMWYAGEEDVFSIVPLLAACPELASLRVNFYHFANVDFLSSVLECPEAREQLKVLTLPHASEGDFTRLFTALGQSQVADLTVDESHSPDFYPEYFKYLARDLLVRLDVDIGSNQRVSEMMVPLAKCTRLAELKFGQCGFRQPTAFTQLSQSVIKLSFGGCSFVDDLDWSFLVGGGIQELEFNACRGVDGKALGSALAACLRAKGLKKLWLDECKFINNALAVIGVEVGRVKSLHVESSKVDGAFIEQISSALQTPNNLLRELTLPYEKKTASGIELFLVPALSHPNCSLILLDFVTRGEARRAAAKAAMERFETICKQRVLLVLLQGQQVRRFGCPLRRLPVEMVRLVGGVLV